jgi:hypothetical protein
MCLFLWYQPQWDGPRADDVAGKKHYFPEMSQALAAIREADLYD